MGLRTLLVAMRLISNEEYNTFINDVSKIPQNQR